MKFTILLFLIGSLQLSANTYSQQAQVTLAMKQASIQEVLSALEKQTSYTFLYKNEVLKNKNKVDVNVRNKDMGALLNEILSAEGLSYTLDDNVVVIYSKKAADVKQAQQAEINVTGSVRDEEDMPLPGATIQLKGTNKTIVSDIDGKFQIRVPDANAVLVISFIGMEKLEITVGKQTDLNVILRYASVKLDDVVVVGAYGFLQKRSDLVSSAFQVSAQQIKDLPASRVDLLLEGKVPGVKIEINTDGADNTRPRYNTRIRGASSLSASSEPLYIVDGAPIFTGEKNNQVFGVNSTISPLSFLNADDIESITVLKDASSTSLYGANGSNGVILITTKKGQKGTPAMKVSTRYGISHINKSTLFKVLDGTQYMTLAKESYNNAGLNPMFFPYQDNPLNSYSTTDTNWTDVFYGPGYSWLTNLSFKGSEKNVSYYVSGSYYENSLTIDGNIQRRFSVRGNTDISLNRNLTLTLLMNASYNTNTLFNPGNDYYEFLPIYSPYNNDGSLRLYNQYIENKGGVPELKTIKFFNSVAEREENDNNQRTLMSNNNIILRYNIMKGLSATGQFSADYQSTFEDIYYARSNWSGRNLLGGGYPVGYASRNHINSLIWTGILRSNYSNTFGKHTVGGILGFEANSKETKILGATGDTFANDHIKEISYAVNRSGSSSSYTVRYASFIGQANYSYDQRYYLVVNGRKDGNSSFGSDVRWANFGSAGVSWNIHNESFFHCKPINVLKLKASFGTAGNSRLGTQESLGVYTYGNNYNYMGSPGGVMSSIPNPTLSWESTSMTNIGLRIRMLDRIEMEIEVYNNKTTDLLSKMDVSWTTGAKDVVRNSGAILNRGIEMDLTTENLKGEFSWTTNLNLSYNKNTLLEIYNNIPKAAGTGLWEVGHDLSTLYLIRWAGVDPRDGAPLWYDVNGNITREYNLNNRVPYKSSQPLLSGGMNNAFYYKGFSLNAFLTYIIGGYAFSSFGRDVSSDGLNIDAQNQSVNQMDRWQNPGDLALSPKPIWKTSTKSVMNSTRYLYNKTHLRFKNISLGYEIPKSKLKPLRLSACTLNLIVDNIGVWTPYDKSDRNSYRQSMSGYPMETTYSLGVDITF